MICSKCGAMISDSAKFCTECGCKIDISSVNTEKIEAWEVVSEATVDSADEVVKLEEEAAQTVAEVSEAFEEEAAQIVAEASEAFEEEAAQTVAEVSEAFEEEAAQTAFKVSEKMEDAVETMGSSFGIINSENDNLAENVVNNAEINNSFAEPVVSEQNQNTDIVNEDNQNAGIANEDNQNVDISNEDNQNADIVNEDNQNADIANEDNQNADIANEDNQNTINQDDMPQPSKAEKKKKKRGFGIRFLTILLGIITAACLIGFMVYSSALKTLSEDCVTEIMDEIPLEKIEVGSIVKSFNIKGFDTSDIADDATVAQVAYKLIPENNRDKYHITEEQIDEILSDDKISGKIKDMLSDNIVEYMANIGSEESLSIKKKDVLKLVEKSRAEIKDITGYTITENDMDVIGDKLDETNLEEIELPRLEEQVPEGLSFIIKGLNSWGKWAVLGITGLFALLILLCNINQIRFGFRAISLVMIIDGFILSVASLVEKAGIFAIENHMNLSFDKKIIRPVIGSFSYNLLFMSAIVLATGVALMIVVVIWKCIANAVERKRERA